ncbi:MAG TPA: outer membrane lipoprotein chaperone LolA [Gemmatimonadaceae bacterium]|nr:outer membrane lipoprotein chaperone LolA [Gemmatimonadaceae bacterium]
MRVPYYMKKLIAGIIAFGIAGSAQAQSPDAIMDRAVKAYADLSSVRAEFTQKITNPLTGTTASSQGVLVRKDPNLLSIKFTSPSGDRIVADGTSLWIYLPSSAPGQVIRTSASASNAMAMVDPGGVFLSSPSTRYTISAAGTATVGGRKTNVVNLVPKKPNGTFSRAKVWIDTSSDLIRQFEVVDANGLTRLVTITSLKPNASVASSEFRFVPPKNARVLDSAGY